jgi:exodeoxyribonuclease VII small subunit
MTKEPDVPFEAALEQIEQIVADLERGEPELSRALAKYERAVGLLAHCNGLIDGAERTVALLDGIDELGRPVATPFDATATADRDAPKAPGRKPAPKGASPSRSPTGDEAKPSD